MASNLRSKRKSKMVETIENERPKKLEISPPKQRKIKNPNEELLSPSRLLDRLNLDEIENSSETELITKPKTKYQNARKILNSSETNSLIGREKELEELTRFLDDHLKNSKSGSLYISGPPGTGKTASLSKILKSSEIHEKFIQIYINCTSITTVGSIYKKITNELKLNSIEKTEKAYLNTIEKYLKTNHKMILMVLDEIDQLIGHKQSVLYTIFEWPSKESYKIILIGIANSLDLTDRLLIRLNVKCNLKPTLLHFQPYSKQQIIDIFKSRLNEAGVMDIFPPVTIQLLAGKVAAVNGDVRRALDIGRRVVEIAEQQQKKKSINSINLTQLNNNDLNNDQKSDTVELKQVINVLNDVYGGSQNLTDNIDEESFPLQQKILICSLLVILKNDKNKDITIGRLHNIYQIVCKKRNILAVDQAEFVGLCQLVETRGMIRIVGKKEPRLNKIVLQWDEEECNAALKDKQLIASILNDVSCLGK